MGIIVNQNEHERSALRDRITAELREKTIRTQKLENDTDLVEDSKYVKGFKETGRYAWIWALAVVFAVVLLVAILFVK